MPLYIYGNRVARSCEVDLIVTGPVYGESIGTRHSQWPELCRAFREAHHWDHCFLGPDSPPSQTIVKTFFEQAKNHRPIPFIANTSQLLLNHETHRADSVE